jgi:hypothetical protein
MEGLFTMFFSSIKPGKNAPNDQTQRPGDPRFKTDIYSGTDLQHYNPIKWLNSRQQRKNAEKKREKFRGYRYSEVSDANGELEPIGANFEEENSNSKWSCTAWHFPLKPATPYSDDLEIDDDLDLDLELESCKEALEETHQDLTRIKSQASRTFQAIKTGRCVIPAPENPEFRPNPDFGAVPFEEDTKQVRSKVKDVVSDLQGLVNDMQLYADRTGQRSITPTKIGAGEACPDLRLIF